MNNLIGNRKRVAFIFVTVLVIVLISVIFKSSNVKAVGQSVNISNMRKTLNATFSEEERWPERYQYEGKSHIIEYTMDERLTEYIKKVLKRYRSDYSSVVVVDNGTGHILAAIDYTKKTKKFGTHLTFSSTHPSASLFKIVTAAALFEDADIDPETIFKYRGKGSTLYRYQLEDKLTRWTRHISFKKAFAFSNNVVFAKAAIKNINSGALYKKAYDFGFNQDLIDEIALSKSTFLMPEDQYNLAELACGFNLDTQMSPVHAALLSQVVANGGIMREPKVVARVYDPESGSNIWDYEHFEKRVIEEPTAEELQRIMGTVISYGTARGSFRSMHRSLRNNLILGGKTGSITGGLPHGKRDWFTAYAVPKNDVYGEGISVAVMNVNVKHWYVKAPYIAKSVIEYYYKKIRELR